MQVVPELHLHEQHRLVWMHHLPSRRWCLRSGKPFRAAERCIDGLRVQCRVHCAHERHRAHGLPLETVHGWDGPCPVVPILLKRPVPQPCQSPFISVLAFSPFLGSSPLPTYDPLGGPQGKGHVSFDGTKSQCLDAGPRTLNIATNGGLTIVAVVRFTGTGDPVFWQMILDLGSGAAIDNLILSREAGPSSSNLRFIIFNDDNNLVAGVDSGCTNIIVQDKWLTVVARYRESTRAYWYTSGTKVAAETELSQPQSTS